MIDSNLKDPDYARQFVTEQPMTRQQIKLTRRVMKTARFIPGFPIKMTPEVRAEIENILLQKEKELDERIKNNVPTKQ
jgi:hypothetical protein